MANYRLEGRGIGVDVTVKNLTAENTLGETAMGDDGSHWVYVVGTEDLTQGMCVAINAAGVALKVTSALALAQNAFGFVQQAVTIASTPYYWVCDDSGGGAAVVAALSAAVANTPLATSGTAGILDDAYTTFVPILGVHLLSSNASTAVLTAFFRNMTSFRVSGV
jgi:hypothetical protein